MFQVISPLHAVKMTSSKLPYELVQHVLDTFAPSMGNKNSLCARSHQKRDKRGLVACSLTCRYWSSRCRPHLFDSIVLRSSTDLQDLLSFLGHSPTLGVLLRHLEIDERHSPWAHRVFLTLPTLTPHLLSLRLRGPPYVVERRRNVWLARPPRLSPLLPALCSQFRTLEVLELENIYFPTFAQLARCIGAFPSLRTVYCGRPIWEHESQFPTVRGAECVREVHVVESPQASWPLTRLLLAPPRRRISNYDPDTRSELPHLPPEDITAITTLLRIVYGSIPSCSGEIVQSSEDGRKAAGTCSCELCH